ncbi:MAG: purine-binding chemotaxis protein CheW [Nitriliruptoraceae bacterium]|jgi:purine-binding chemotaxis protein CheW
MHPTQLCTLVVGSALFGVDVLRVQEVIRSQPMTNVPRAHPAVGGLINLRGQIVTAIDLRARLGLPSSTAPEPLMHVVVRTDEGAVSFLVDDVGDVIELASLKRERAPDTLAPHMRELITAVYKLDDALLLQLDADRLVELPSHAYDDIAS